MTAAFAAVNWVTVSQVATAVGTLVLAIATFGSIRTSRRSTELAERTLRAGVRPLLIPSREDDLPERVRFGDGVVLEVPGHGGVLRHEQGNVYMAIALRNGGAGLAVIHAWHVTVGSAGSSARAERPELDRFRAHTRDLYVPVGETGFWQGAIRDRDDPDFDPVARAAGEPDSLVMVDLLYGDYEGQQRTITRFRIGEREGEGPRAEVLRVWVLDGVDPRRID